MGSRRSATKGRDGKGRERSNEGRERRKEGEGEGREIFFIRRTNIK